MINVFVAALTLMKTFTLLLFWRKCLDPERAEFSELLYLFIYLHLLGRCITLHSAPGAEGGKAINERLCVSVQIEPTCTTSRTRPRRLAGLLSAPGFDPVNG